MVGVACIYIFIYIRNLYLLIGQCIVLKKTRCTKQIYKFQKSRENKVERERQSESEKERKRKRGIEFEKMQYEETETVKKQKR